MQRYIKKRELNNRLNALIDFLRETDAYQTRERAQVGLDRFNAVEHVKYAPTIVAIATHSADQYSATANRLSRPGSWRAVLSYNKLSSIAAFYHM